MASVRDLLARKGAAVVSIAPTQTVLDAARLMNDRTIGGLVVVENDVLAGVFTERDILRRVVAAQRDPATTLVREVMTKDVITCSPETPLDECRSVMTEKRIRHLPVIGPAGIAGIITVGDLLALEVSESRDTIGHLQSYVFDVRPV
jgi:CBS domain-containing protein